MLNKNISFIVLTFFYTIFFHFTYAQNNIISIDTIVIKYKKKDTSVAIKKYKGAIPILSSAVYKLNNVDSVSVDLMEQLIDSPIIVKDKKGNVYKVIRYNFGYRKKDVYVDESVMEVKTRYDYFSFLCYETPLEEKWRKYIKNSIQNKEQFWFENIIVENEAGEKFFAPNITIKTF